MHHLCSAHVQSLSLQTGEEKSGHITSWVSWPSQEHCQCTHMWPPLPFYFCPLSLYHKSGHLTLSSPSPPEYFDSLRTKQLIRVQYACLQCHWLRAGLCRPIGRGNGCKIKRATDSTFWETDLKSETIWLMIDNATSNLDDWNPSPTEIRYQIIDKHIFENCTSSKCLKNLNQEQTRSWKCI